MFDHDTLQEFSDRAAAESDIDLSQKELRTTVFAGEGRGFINVSEPCYTAAQVAELLRQMQERCAKAVPTNWCDSLLTGPGVALKSHHDNREI